MRSGCELVLFRISESRLVDWMSAAFAKINKKEGVMKKYEKPCFVACSGKVIQEKLWGSFAGGKWCFGCTNCNCN